MQKNIKIENDTRYKISPELFITKNKSIEMLKKLDKNNQKQMWNFIIGNMKFVIYIINKHFQKVTDEMVSDGIIGFYKALKNYNSKYSYGSFFSYVDIVIAAEVRNGWCERTTQISPAIRLVHNRTPKTNTLEIPLDLNISDNNLNIKSLRETISDPIDLNPANILCEIDDSMLFKRFLKRLKHNNKWFQRYKELLSIMAKTDKDESATSNAAKTLGCSKQNINSKMRRLLEAINSSLKRDPSLKKELELILGHRCRDIVQKRENAKRSIK